jgi:hypothetical protein
MTSSPLLSLLALYGAALLLLAYAPVGCVCWGVIGHSTVALVAQSLLTSDASACILAYLPETGGQLSPIASWADEVRVTTEPWNRPLHGAVTSWYAGQYHFSSDCWANRLTSEWLAGCTDGAMQNFTHRLNNVGGVNYTQRVEALKYITHFVGDISQPLQSDHTSAHTQGH